MAFRRCRAEPGRHKTCPYKGWHGFPLSRERRWEGRHTGLPLQREGCHCVGGYHALHVSRGGWRVRITGRMVAVVVVWGAVLAGCEPGGPTPAAFFQALPTPSASVVPVSETPAFRLRSAARDFARAFSDARFEDAYALASPSLRDACDGRLWADGLAGAASLLRSSNGLSEGLSLTWKVELVEPAGDAGTVFVSVTTTGRPVALQTWAWRQVDGRWWFDEPVGEVCGV